MDFIQKSYQKNKTDTHVSVELLNKSYIVSCPPDTEPALHNAARLLNQKMVEAQQLGHDYSNEQAAIIAALNLAYDLNFSQQNPQPSNQIQETLDMLTSNPAFEPISDIYSLNDEDNDYFESDDPDADPEDDLEEELEDDDDLDEEDDEDYDDYLDEDDPDFNENEDE